MAVKPPPAEHRPKLISFDLDATLWYPEMYMLDGPPFKLSSCGRAVIDAGGERTSLMGDAPAILRSLATDAAWEGTEIAYICTYRWEGRDVGTGALRFVDYFAQYCENLDVAFAEVQARRDFAALMCNVETPSEFHGDRGMTEKLRAVVQLQLGSGGLHATELALPWGSTLQIRDDKLLTGAPSIMCQEYTTGGHRGIELGADGVATGTIILDVRRVQPDDGSEEDDTPALPNKRGGGGKKVDKGKEGPVSKKGKKGGRAKAGKAVSAG